MRTIKSKSILSTFLKFIPDTLFFNKLYLKFIYRYGMGSSLDFNNIQTLNEKMQYLKLFDKNDLYTQVADKLKVRNYVASRIGYKYLIPLLKTGKNVNILKISDLPSPPYILKANHDCSGGLIVRNIEEHLLNVKGVSSYIEKNKQGSISQYNLNYMKHFLKKRFAYNHYYITKEWQYKNIDKAYLFESLLSNSKGQVPNDYKFHCINGVVEFIYVSNDREGANTRKIYYPDWSPAPFTWAKKGGEYKFKGEEVAKPKNLEEMLELAEKLSRGFKYIRVDLYSDDTGIFFGELTLHQGSGIERILPSEFDLYYGKKIVID